MNKGEIKKAYLGFTNILDRHEEFTEKEIKEYVELCKLALEGWKEWIKKLKLTFWLKNLLKKMLKTL